MNWHKVLKNIYHKLELSGFQVIKDDIHEGQLSGGTSGEIFSIVLSKLLEIKRSNKEVYQLVEIEIEEFIRYAKSINYLGKDFIE